MVNRKKNIDTVAAELIATRDSAAVARSIPSTCLILGAGCSVASGIPLWDEFAATVLSELGIEDVDGTGEVDAVDRLEQYLAETPTNRGLVVSLIDQTLRQAHASRGYRYLARLIGQGFFSTVITTNWDWLLEDAIYRLMRADEVLVLTRDSAPDEFLARQIQGAGSRVVVLKLHGDPKAHVRTGEGTTTRFISDVLLDALRPRLGKLQLVGSSARDIDVLHLLFQRLQDADILAVSRQPAALAEPLKSLATAVLGGNYTLSALRYRPIKRGDVDEPQEDAKINIGEFDHYFCQLALSIERRLLKNSAIRLAQIEQSLLRKEESGLSYINYSQITRMAKAFIRQVTRWGTPDVVFFVNDPSAAGGMELKKRIEGDLEAQGIPVGVIQIEGERSNRTFRRQFRGADRPPVDVNDADVRLVHVLDSISFSGNTMTIAREKVRSWYPNAEVRLGALVVSQLVLDREEGVPEEERIYYESVTDRFEIFFPWGVTQTTADFDRKFPSLDRDRLVHIARRPWGAIEILADEEQCSVRLLTIEANRRLSFQRHLCREELFVALDDNIGLDICSSELKPDADPYDPSVKSMVLEKGDYILISRGIWHRTKASMERVRLLEVGFGVYDQQYDIERLFDDFERTNADGAQ